VFTEKPDVETDIQVGGSGTIAYTDGTTSGTIPIASAADNPKFQQLKSDWQREFNEELDSVRKGYFPMLKLGLMFRF
ncbi:MAG: hypothetical protein LBO78_03015, partial [Rickettsiales bacterium]|jgi:hypothetical protein|nr:hypothetical protein [Rickettsiales bacterium]